MLAIDSGARGPESGLGTPVRPRIVLIVLAAFTPGPRDPPYGLPLAMAIASLTDGPGPLAAGAVPEPSAAPPDGLSGGVSLQPSIGRGERAWNPPTAGRPGTEFETPAEGKFVVLVSEFCGFNSSCMPRLKPPMSEPPRPAEPKYHPRGY